MIPLLHRIKQPRLYSITSNLFSSFSSSSTTTSTTTSTTSTTPSSNNNPSEINLTKPIPDLTQSLDLGGSLSDNVIRDALASIGSTTKRGKMLPRMSSRPLIEPVKDQEMVCPVTSRRRRLRQTVSNNGLEVIRPLGRGSFGRIVLARRVEDGKYYAVKLQRLTGSELTPDQVATAKMHRNDISTIIQSLPDGSFVRDHFGKSLVELDSKLKLAAPKEGEYRLFDGKQSRRAVAESVILDHLQSSSEGHPEFVAWHAYDEQPGTQDLNTSGSGKNPKHAQQQNGSSFIVQKHGSFEDREWVYIILDYLTGGTLNDRMKQSKNGVLNEKDAKFYLAELLMGLKYLNSKNVSHRDIKPANIMLDSYGHTVLMDFGLSTRTKKGLRTFCGTAEYIAPEVLTQKKWDATMLDTWRYVLKKIAKKKFENLLFHCATNNSLY